MFVYNRYTSSVQTLYIVQTFKNLEVFGYKIPKLYFEHYLWKGSIGLLNSTAPFVFTHQVKTDA